MCGVRFNRTTCAWLCETWIINVHMILRQGIWSSFTGDDMNKLKYYPVLRGYPIWNLLVSQVDPMGWSILARLSNSDVLPTILFRWERTNGIIWVCYYIFFRASFINVLLVSYAYEKNKKNIALDTCIMNLLACVVFVTWVPCMHYVVLVWCVENMYDYHSD